MKPPICGPRNLGGAEASIRLEAGAGKAFATRENQCEGYVQWETVPIPVETVTTYRAPL